MFAPKGTPPAVLKVLRDAVRQAVQDPEFKTAMDKVETQMAYQDADEFKKCWDKDSETLADVIRRSARSRVK